ncbi:pimeloyl-ACP methyl ester carboxylesterase [Paraburkholderia bannensis]|uniref:Pimeloyl-ACP methyl ester carboxylesterase n=1 Tax=Paraburkholderia bannensis TaxID=765414 RepID=A0A7W9U5W7_9BURK|nr:MULTISPECIES: alpha/beta fold hydrolase [Paraburkholderia]MBB3261479.1 pimeloyl-ACP methyl ester carboxylesterase [Paraburkholderia sp. WP4_3_2]MBB6106535.1 pimeloyl-ACP methyl ester carboxylesterase [Paraburkholderia bannensis]
MRTLRDAPRGGGREYEASAVAAVPGAIERLDVNSDGVRLAVYVSGPRDAPPMILVHGYPDSARVWEGMRRELETRFRVIAYDVRGAGASAAPSSRADYTLAQLARDLIAVADATCGARPFHLVAHDWGSIQCWEAVTDPANAVRIASYTSISGPCLDHVFRVRMSLAQSLRSWYIALFHLPLVPQLVWRLGGAALWPWWLHRTEGVRARRDPDQLRNCINGLQLYRANFIARARKPRERRTEVPVQVIVPRFDRYVTPALTANVAQWLGRHRREIIDAPHWTVVRDAPLIAARVQRFIAWAKREEAHSACLDL